MPDPLNYAWHVRGTQQTHLGPHHGEELNYGSVPIGSETLCGIRMDLVWVHGEGGPMCKACGEAWSGF